MPDPKTTKRLSATEQRRLDPDRIRVQGLGRGLVTAYVISESGLYKLAMRSDKPIAKPFLDWVTPEPAMSDVTNFIFKGPAGPDNTATIRVVTIENQPWFVAADVLSVMGFSRIDNMLRVLSPEERSKTPHPVRGVDGAMRVHAAISESGLYKRVLRSDKPEARTFQDWVRHEVLPAIRKGGAYAMGEEKGCNGEMPGVVASGASLFLWPVRADLCVSPTFDRTPNANDHPPRCRSLTGNQKFVRGHCLNSDGATVGILTPTASGPLSC